MPRRKLQKDILIMNLALIAVERIHKCYPSIEVSVSSVEGGLISLAIVAKGKFNLSDFTRQVDSEFKEIPVDYFSVSATNLQRVYIKLCQRSFLHNLSLSFLLFVNLRPYPVIVITVTITIHWSVSS